MLSAQVDASGETSGGRIRIGGEYQGGKGLQNDELPNAEILTLDRGTHLRADGEGNDSDGGRVIVWSDVDTMALANISARPGLTAGKGGFVEVSSAGELSYSGTIETGRGERRGEVLIDPKNIIIASASLDPTSIVIGRNFSGDNVNLPVSDGGEFGGYAVSLDGTRMAVGYSKDHGFNDSKALSGAVYLYSFSDNNFNGGALEGIMGYGYTGGKNVDVTGLADNDRFGRDVSLDGNRIAIGVPNDNGGGPTAGDSGAVFLYSFADSAFNGATFESQIGYGYSGGKNYDMSGILNASDLFGWSVSLDGNRLAVGAREADGFNNLADRSGEVYLFSFADSMFSNPVLESTIGNGYIGGKNIDVNLDAFDRFSWSLSLSGNSLAVGARNGDGYNNLYSDSGEVYLFSFADAAFSGGIHEATFGNGYTGAKDQNINLRKGDVFGLGLSLDGTRLAIGASGDDGYLDARNASGTVYLYSFADTTFGGATLEANIGWNYGNAGGKNLSRNNEADQGDQFGHSISLDGNRLVVGATGDDGPGNANAGQGAYHYYTFSDSTFSGGAYSGTLGRSYTGGRNITLHRNTAPDSIAQTRMGVSVDNNRIAIGLPYGDGFNDSKGDSGEVYLYSFASSDYDSAVLEGIIGHGYTGGKNVDMSGYFDSSDFFGESVSLDGNLLAVGARDDDGSAGGGKEGAVYLYSFADSVFSSGTLEARIGEGYNAGKDFDLSLDNNDRFGSGVSLDGSRLAVSEAWDDGLGNSRNDSGAVRLFTFTGNDFSNLTLEGTIGYGYDGVKNLDLSNLGNADLLGNVSGLSLDGNRIAITASRDDGLGNSAGNSGAAYLITFDDSSFTNPTLQSTMGYGYTGGNNIDMSLVGLSNNDTISGVALEGTVLALGAAFGDGATNGQKNSGEIYIYSFDDLLFSNGQLDSQIGLGGYSNPKDITTNIAGTSDYLGTSLDMSNGTLVASAPGGDGASNRFSSSGQVHVFKGNTFAAGEGFSFANLGANTIGITPGSITALLNSPQDVTLQASNDIALIDDLIANNPGGDAGNLSLQAGRSIIINANIDTDNGDLTLLANEDLAEGVVNAQRDAGDAEITMAAGTSINAGTGNVHIRLDDGTGKTNSGSGDITLETITAHSILVHGIDQVSDIIVNDILTANGVGDPLILASGRNFINNHGAGALVTPSDRWLVYSDEGALDTANGLVANFSLNSCEYLGACGALGAGNGFLHEYVDSIIRITVNADRFYGTANPDNATLQSLFVYDGFQGMDNASDLDVLPTASIAASANATASAGTTHNITLSGGSDDFYTYYLLDESVLTITKKPVTATWNGNVSKTYGDANPNPSSADFTYSGFENGQTAINVTPSPIANFGAIDQTTDVGSYNFALTFANENNYSITAADGTLVINKRDITANWTGSISRDYGDANPNIDTSNFNYTGFVNGDNNMAVTASANFGAISETTNAGTYNNAVAGNFVSMNYNITNAPTTNITINKRDITATVQDQSRAYGSADPALGFGDISWNNLANGETGSVIDAFGYDFTTSAAASNAGTTHDINLTGFNDNNYNLTGFASGTLTINKRDITATVQDQSRAYGSADPALGFGDISWNNLANGETGSVIDAFGYDFTTSAAASNAGTTHDINLTGFNDNNYNLTGFASGTLTINKRDITATVGNTSRFYGYTGQNLSWSDVVWNNLVNGDTGADLDSISFDAPSASLLSAAGTNHVLDISAFTDNNYNLTGTVAGQLNITKAPLTVNVNSFERHEDKSNPVFTFSLNGLRNGEDSSVLSGLALSSTAIKSSPIGLYAITAMGGVATNYFVDIINDGQLSIIAEPQINPIPSTFEIASTDRPYKNRHYYFDKHPAETLKSNPSSENMQDNAQFAGLNVIPDEMTNLPAPERGNFLITITQSIKDFFING